MKTRLLLLCVACSVVPSVLAATSDAAHFSTIPNGMELTTGASKLDVQILENRVARVHVTLDGRSTERTLVMDPHPALRPPAANYALAAQRRLRIGHAGTHRAHPRDQAVHPHVSRPRGSHAVAQ